MNIVLDSGIFMHRSSIPPDIDASRIYITPEVEDEIISMTSESVYTVFRSKFNVSVTSASPYATDLIKTKTRTVGEYKLSTPDISVLALAWEISQEEETLLLSDDYGVLNIARIMGVRCRGVNKHKHIRVRNYYFICKACGEKIREAEGECDTCGSQSFLRRYS